MSGFASNNSTPSLVSFDQNLSSGNESINTLNNVDSNKELSVDSKTPSSWDAQDDILLRHLKEIKRLGWKEIAQYFSNRTPNACQFRWRRLRSGSLKHKSIAQNMELETVKIHGEIEAPKKMNSNPDAVNSKEESGLKSSTAAAKKKPRSTSLSASISPNLRQQVSSELFANNITVAPCAVAQNPHHFFTSGANVTNGSSGNHMALPNSQNFVVPTNDKKIKYRKNSVNKSPPLNRSRASSRSSSISVSSASPYPIVNDEQIGYIPKIKIRSRRNSTVSLSARQQPSSNNITFGNSHGYLDSHQSDFRSRSNSASNTIMSMERRLSVLMGSNNLQINNSSTIITSGSMQTPGSGNPGRRGSGKYFYNPLATYSAQGQTGSGFLSTQREYIHKDEDVAIEDD